jgi:hypothetical protein
MLEKCHKYSVAINAKGRPFPTEPLIMALLLEQHKMINWLQKNIYSKTKILQMFPTREYYWRRELKPVLF